MHKVVCYAEQKLRGKKCRQINPLANHSFLIIILCSRCNIIWHQVNSLNTGTVLNTLSWRVQEVLLGLIPRRLNMLRPVLQSNLSGHWQDQKTKLLHHWNRIKNLFFATKMLSDYSVCDGLLKMVKMFAFLKTQFSTWTLCLNMQRSYTVCMCEISASLKVWKRHCSINKCLYKPATKATPCAKHFLCHRQRE